MGDWESRIDIGVSPVKLDVAGDAGAGCLDKCRRLERLAMLLVPVRNGATLQRPFPGLQDFLAAKHARRRSAVASSARLPGSGTAVITTAVLKPLVVESVSSVRKTGREAVPEKSYWKKKRSTVAGTKSPNSKTKALLSPSAPARQTARPSSIVCRSRAPS
jgi:hypothetical protein